LIDRVKIYGDPSRKDVWKQLDEIVQTPYKSEDGRELKPIVVAIDSGGHHTSEVYQYARERQSLGVVAIKGMSTKNKPPIGKASKVDLNAQGKTLKKGSSGFPCWIGHDQVTSVRQAEAQRCRPRVFAFLSNSRERLF
jgi:phage terminase large subunit GpA-like protein